MKKIEWWIVNANGRLMWAEETRVAARQSKRELDQDIFEEWNSDIAYPLKIVRKEWALVNEKVVR